MQHDWQPKASILHIERCCLLQQVSRVAKIRVLQKVPQKVCASAAPIEQVTNRSTVHAISRSSETVVLYPKFATCRYDMLCQSCITRTDHTRQTWRKGRVIETPRSKRDRDRADHTNQSYVYISPGISGLWNKDLIRHTVCHSVASYDKLRYTAAPTHTEKSSWRCGTKNDWEFSAMR